MKTPSTGRRKPKHKSLKVAKGELWKFILRNDFSFWKPKPAKLIPLLRFFPFPLLLLLLLLLLFPFPLNKKFHKTHSHFYKNSSTTAPSDPLYLLFPLSFSVVHRYNQSLFCFCVRAKSVCVFALPCSSVSLRWVRARPRARVFARAKKERGKNTKREKERERERKFTEITYVISA